MRQGTFGCPVSFADQDSLQAVEDQMKAEREFGVDVIVVFQRVLDDHLGEVGVLVGRDRRHERLRHLLRADVQLGGRIELLASESADVAVEQ
jgi:hypothetical protein